MKRKQSFYGWWIVRARNLICLHSFGVFSKPMSAKFGWMRATTAGAYFLSSIESGIAVLRVG
jgi:hypothetical protein